MLLKIAIVACGTALALGGVAAFAGSAQADGADAAPRNLRISGATRGELFPGATADLLVTVTNPNAFPVTITDVVANGRVRSNRSAACRRTGIVFTGRHGLRLRLAAGATRTFTLRRALAMSNDSDNGCQGALFSVPLSLRAAA